jgi:hypothetical protein
MIRLYGMLHIQSKLGISWISLFLFLFYIVVQTFFNIRKFSLNTEWSSHWLVILIKKYISNLVYTTFIRYAQNGKI